MTDQIEGVSTAGTEKLLLKPRVHRHIVKTLAMRILGNEFQPGSALPSEPELCDAFNISRSTVREAVRVLGSKGLVTTRPRTGTVVRVREDWNLLDADLLSWSMELQPSAELVLSLIEARQVIEPAAARFAALRASVPDIARMEHSFAEMSRHKAAQDFDAFNRADIGFHTALLKASHNIVFQQLSNTIGAALEYSFKLTVSRAREPGGSLPNHGEVVERIRTRDPEGAFASMARLLNLAIVDLGLSGMSEEKHPGSRRDTSAESL